MILVDSALARHRADGKPPIRVGMIGGGTSEIQRNVIARCMGL